MVMVIMIIMIFKELYGMREEAESLFRRAIQHESASDNRSCWRTWLVTCLCQKKLYDEALQECLFVRDIYVSIYRMRRSYIPKLFIVAITT